jgi:hypothetical protein
MQAQKASVTLSNHRETKRKSRVGCGLFVIVLLGLFGFFGYVATGPYRTLSTLRNALSQGDATLLAQCVDFPTLRQNLKTQLSARANGGVNAVVPSGILAQIAGGIAGSVIDATVDTFVTPTGLSRLLAGGSLVANQAPSVGGQAPQNHLENAHGSFESSSIFVVTVPSSAVVIELSRNGLDWQVTNVRLSPSAP